MKLSDHERAKAVCQQRMQELDLRSEDMDWGGQGQGCLQRSSGLFEVFGEHGPDPCGKANELHD
jgi:hypothetical protein